MTFLLCNRERGMQITILIEPIDTGRFRAVAAEPFADFAEGQSENEATELLRRKLQDRLSAGAHLSVINLAEQPGPCSPQPKIQFEPLPEDDWFFRTMREAIAENRKRDEAES